METKALKKQMGAAIAMVLVAAIALGAATFAWFVSNNAVQAEGVDVSTTSSVPNLYITSAGKTADSMTPATDTNPTKLYPVSTNNATDFFETLHWTTGTKNAVADQYQEALTHESGKTVYADYTFTLGVTNGSMDVYFDSADAATTLAAAANMGTAGRFAVKVDDNWLMFKVPGTETKKGYYTDKGADTGDYWVTGAGDSSKLGTATYADFDEYAGSIDKQGQAQRGTNKLTTISSDATKTVTVRVWYEGCDKDCVSENAGNGITNAITGNLGFVGVQAAQA